MQNLKTQTFQTVKIIVLALVLAAGLQYVSAATSWTPAAGAPPGNNTAAPVNVGATGQSKTGGLTVGTANPSLGFQVAGGAVRFTSPALGTPSSGYVLKSDGTGNVTWQPDTQGSGGGGGGVNCIGTCLQNQILKYYQTGQIVTGGMVEVFDSPSSKYRVGVNKGNPGYELDVAGRANGTELCINGTCKSAWPGAGGLGGQTETPLSTGINKTSSPYTTDLDCPNGSVMVGWTYDNQGTSQGGHGKVKIRCRPLQ